MTPRYNPAQRSTPRRDPIIIRSSYQIIIARSIHHAKHFPQQLTCVLVKIIHRLLSYASVYPSTTHRYSSIAQRSYLNSLYEAIPTRNRKQQVKQYTFTGHHARCVFQVRLRLSVGIPTVDCVGGLYILPSYAS